MHSRAVDDFAAAAVASPLVNSHRKKVIFRFALPFAYLLGKMRCLTKLYGCRFFVPIGGKGTV
jgi:hypothetical protein